MKPTAGQISVAARMGATDRDLCEQFDLSADQLQKYGSVIVEARAELRVAQKFQMNRSAAAKVKPKQQQ